MTDPVHVEVDANGIAVVTIDVAERSINVFTPALVTGLRAAFERIAAAGDIVGAVITSGKPSGFLAGADLLELVTAHDQGLSAAQAAALIAPAADLLRQIERCGKPVVAAINGSALGGGYELCLACHHRLLIDTPEAVVGLPEVNVGLLPAGGGTQRLPRLLGIERALPLLLSGRHVRPAEALRLGLVDAVLPAAELLPAAREWILASARFVQPWDRKGFTVPAGAGALAAHANESFSIGMARVRRDTADNYPAPAAILSCVYEGTLLPIDSALAIERQAFGQLLADPVSRNLMRTLFINRSAARRQLRRPSEFGRQPVRRLGILGSGLMGTGIAQVAAGAGIEVVLLDTSEAGALAGKERVARGYQREIEAGRLSPGEGEAGLDRILASDRYGELAGCDFVVEAVFEDRDSKAQAFRRAAEALQRAPAGFVMASNTSTLPVTGLARDWIHPEDFIGLHFFSPVERMPIVEVIRGRQTSRRTLARALDLVAQLRKLPIVVNDSPGFYTSRIFCAYIDEGMAMLAEGVVPALIENAGRQAGFAVSPLAVTDEVSIDLQDRVIRQARLDGLPAERLREQARPVIEHMLSIGRLGRKSGGGFYDYVPGQPKRLWPGLAQAFRPRTEQPLLRDVRHRLLYIQALESARCVEEAVVVEPADADLGSVLALGYPAWTGGTLSFIETVGLTPFVAECDRLADCHGERFRPSGWLRQRAQAGQRFYPFNPTQPMEAPTP